MDIRHPHDSFFKQIMTDKKNISDFIRNFLPEDISSKINYDTLQLPDREKTTKNYKKYHMDIIVEAEIDHTPSDIIILFEHKSYKDKFTLIQILSYCISVWENNLKNKESLKPVIPVVFYHGTGKHDLPLNFGDYFDVPEDLKRYIVSFDYELFDTSAYDEDSIQRNCHDNLLLSAFLLSMKNIFAGRQGLEKIFAGLSRLENTGREIIIGYILRSVDIELEELDEIAKKGGMLDMPSLAEKLEKKGEKRGLEKGIQEGIQKGFIIEAQDMVINGLEAKFGEVPSDILDKIKSIEDRERLRNLLREIFKANNMKDFRKLI